MSLLLHATLVEYKNKGVLLQGPSGAGKSDLALRLISRGGQLVTDDQVLVNKCPLNKQLIGQAPAAIQGLLEVRGLGILRFPYHLSWSIDIVIKLKDFNVIPRLPEITSYSILSQNLPCFMLDAFEASVLEKMDLMVRIEHL